MPYLRVVPLLFVAVLASSCGQSPASVATPQVICSISPSGDVTGPQVDLCAQLARRYATLIDTRPMPGVARVSGEPVFRGRDVADSAWGMDWPATQLYPAGIDANVDPGSAETFLHEVGHAWLYPLMAGGRAISTDHRYGSEAPDWLDEAWAMWAPFQEHRQARQSRLAPGITPSLRALVTMPHPVSGHGNRDERHDDFDDPVISFTTDRGKPCAQCDYLPDSARTHYWMRSVRMHQSGKVDTITEYADTMPTRMAPRSVEAERFYPLSYSLLRYIRETGGEAAVRELIARYRVDPTPRAEALEHLPGLPPTLDALEAGWHAFIAERRPEPK